MIFFMNAVLFSKITLEAYTKHSNTQNM